MTRPGFAAHTACLCVVGCFALPAAAKPAPLPPKPPPAPPAALAAILRLELLTRDTTEAVGIVAAPGEAVGRMFVIEKAGKIRILRGSKIDAAPFLDMTGKVAIDHREDGEQGLLGLAFHPDFGKNGRFFINYTDIRSGVTRIVEMRVDAKNPNRADPTTARRLLSVVQPHTNHNGGDLQFGPDGKLYVLLGDGGSSYDPHGNGQRPDTLLGKMIRLDVEATKPKPDVIGRGLRNPWRYSFDRKTGDLFIGEVGQDRWESVHVAPADQLSSGLNFGWSITEGLHCLHGTHCSTKGLRHPLVEYSHAEGCSMTGGYVYRGKSMPELQGIYFFADYCVAFLRSFRYVDDKAVDVWDWKAALDPEAKLAKLASFGQDQEGELYLVTHEGPIYKFVRGGPTRDRPRVSRKKRPGVRGRDARRRNLERGRRQAGPRPDGGCHGRVAIRIPGGAGGRSGSPVG